MLDLITSKNSPRFRGATESLARLSVTMLIFTILLSNSNTALGNTTCPSLFADPYRIVVTSKKSTPKQLQDNQPNQVTSSLHEALRLARHLRLSIPTHHDAIQILLLPGAHLLEKGVVLEPRDSGTPVLPLEIRGAGASSTKLSGAIYQTHPTSSNHTGLQSFPTPFEISQPSFSQEFNNSSSSIDNLQIHNSSARIPVSYWPAKRTLLVFETEERPHETVIKAQSYMQLPTRGALEFAWLEGRWGKPWAWANVPFHYFKFNGRVSEWSIPQLLQPLAPNPGTKLRIRNVRPSPADKTSTVWHIDFDKQEISIHGDMPAHSSIIVSAPFAGITLTNVEHIHFADFGLEFFGGSAIHAWDIAESSFCGMIVRHIGKSGFFLAGRDTTVRNSSFLDIGESGLVLYGLADTDESPARLRAIDNSFQQFGAVVPTYRAAVHAYGRGNHILRNQISNGPHAGIILRGLNHFVASNRLSNLGRATDDFGAIYAEGSDFDQGHVIVGNTIFNIRSIGPAGAVGIYLDNFVSGARVFANRIYAVDYGVVVGGGFGNVVAANTIVDCDYAGIRIDDRGNAWLSTYIRDVLDSYFPDPPMRYLNVVSISAKTLPTHYLNIIHEYSTYKKCQTQVVYGAERTSLVIP